MKRYVSLAIFAACLSAGAGPVTLATDNFVLRDIKEQGLTASSLFKKMRGFGLVDFSICANRAHVWAYDFQQKNIDSAKIFLFFTKKSGNNIYLTWWYHVAPVINENGELLVMDKTLRNRPESTAKWLSKISDTNRCYEIKDEDTDLLQRIYAGVTFPAVTSPERGHYDCYYRIMPSGYWFPRSIAERLLGQDENGAPIAVEELGGNVGRKDAYSACRQSFSGPINGLLGSGSRVCRRYLGQERRQ